jgi:hypothetical protein
MPISTPFPKPSRVPRALARLGRRRRPLPKRPGTEFDSSDPDGLIRRLDDSDCFCRDTRAGRMYHPKDVSYREIVPRDSLHVTVRNGRTVSTHVDRHSPLARRQPGGECRYSPLRIAAHNVSGAARDLVRLAVRRDRGHEHERSLVDDHTVREIVSAKESGGAGPDPAASEDSEGVTARPQPSAPAVGEAPRRGPR